MNEVTALATRPINDLVQVLIDGGSRGKDSGRQVGRGGTTMLSLKSANCYPRDLGHMSI